MQNIKLSSRLKISDKILFRELQGEAVLLNAETGIYFGLDQAGTAAWLFMQKQKNLRSVLDSLLAEYEVDPTICREDLFRFTAKLQKNGLIQVDEA